ncbi:uridine kinase [Streptomyces sp. NPDC058145]|uniref:uridine kinase family protein n=1 Tax=Streptomyces sp. NPDC058145 TaxID=3346356 RepID=UPI0036E731A3
MLAIAGGTASGKSTLAKALALHRPGAVALIHLVDFYVPAHEPHRGIRTLSATGAETLDWNHPGSVDEDAAAAALEAAATNGQHRIVVVEGLFALTTLPKVVAHATWRIYVHAPDDIRLARKLIRKIEIQHQDPLVSLRNHLLSGRDRHAQYVAPSRHRADLVLDGTMPTTALLTAVDHLVGAHLPPTLDRREQRARPAIRLPTGHLHLIPFVDTPAFRWGRKRNSCGVGQGAGFRPRGEKPCPDRQV